MAAPKQTETVHVIVTMEIRDTKLNKFLEAAKPMVARTNKEQGCIRYNIHQDKKNPMKIVMVEEWESQQSLTQHLRQEHVREFNELQQKEQWARKLPSVYFCGGPLVKLN
mmetsp:Transcript_67000/g.106542  ORF Transcript_67000/g.106542 Transcript_67000/m.106542 type:complete len:110 (-) Transcript_67000:29-358(-)